MTAQLGTVPTTAERVELLEEQLADALARIAAPEARGDVDDQIDGAAPTALPPNWKPLPEAAKLAGFSWSGMRKKITTRRDGPWWKRRGNRILVNVTAMPRKAV
jgi:hypothetical protein